MVAGRDKGRPSGVGVEEVFVVVEQLVYNGTLVTRAVKFHDRKVTVRKKVFSLSQNETFHGLALSCRNNDALMRAKLFCF